MKRQSRRPLVVICTILLIIFISGLLVTYAFKALDNITTGNIELLGTPDALESDLSKAISQYKANEIKSIDLSHITNFSWDRLYMFGSYTPNSEIDDAVGRSWREICYTQIGTSDSYTLLVFLRDDVVVHCLDFPRNIGDFKIPEQANQTGISSQESIFVINEHGDLIWASRK